MTTPIVPELAATLRTACRAFLADIESADPDRLDDLLDEFMPDLIAAGVGDPASAIAARVRSTGGAVLLPLGEWVGEGTSLHGTVLVVPSEGEVQITSWSAMRDDPVWWVGEHAAFVGRTIVEELPFHFDGEAWEGTHYDRAFGDTEWVFHLDGEELKFDLGDVELRYAARRPDAPDGMLLEIATGGYSMTTGEIGLTLVIDGNGAIWRHQWGYIDEYLGRPDEYDLVGAALAGAVPEVGFSTVVHLSSDLLDREQMRIVVDGVLDDVDLESAELPCQVDCVGFSGHLTVFLRVTGDGDEDADDADDHTD